MNKRFSNMRTILLLGCSMLIGMGATTFFAPAGGDQLASHPTETAASLPATETPESNPGQFVQDPPRRSAYRPDFSQALRRSNQRSNFFMLRAFHDAVGDSWKSTVKLTHEGDQVALGAIVDSDGLIITKASQLPSSDSVTCRFYDGDMLDADVVQRVEEFDLALLRVERQDLPVVKWDASNVPERGRWLATTDVQAGLPSAVGVVSAGVQRVGKANAVLGVHLTDSEDGAAVTLVLPGSGADQAGLQVGDSIYAVDGQQVNSHRSFQAAVKGGIGGQIVKLSVNRADQKFETEGRLMDLAEELLDETEMEVNGPISARASGFERVFLHDTVLEPNQCGGPLVNLDGNVVGINIARAGRVCSYALPADVVEPIVKNLVEQARVVSRPIESQATLRPIR